VGEREVDVQADLEEQVDEGAAGVSGHLDAAILMSEPIDRERGTAAKSGTGDSLLIRPVRVRKPWLPRRLTLATFRGIHPSG
jgi:hypothetical protein